MLSKCISSTEFNLGLLFQETCIPIPALTNQFAMDLQYLLDKNFIAKSITTKVVFSSISARSFFFACSWLIIARMWAFQRLMHVVDWLISYFNCSSLFGKTCLCLVTKGVILDCIWKTLTLITGIFMTAVVTITLVQFLCWIWQSELDTVVSYTFTQSSREQWMRKSFFRYLRPAIRSFIKLSNSPFFNDLQIEISSSKASEPSYATLSRPAKLFLCDAEQLLRMFHSVLSDGHPFFFV